MVERTARCQCGALRATVNGEPDLVNLCHCHDCQRRTGTPASWGVYFKRSAVRLDGEHKVYERDAPDGRKIRNHFCPHCGATVYWTLDLRPEHCGIAGGAFNDPQLFPPTYSIWEQSMMPWMKLPDGIMHFPQARVF